MTHCLLEARSILVQYGARTVLNIERLAIYENDRIALVGENGAGKSTLLSVLDGSLLPDGGDVQRRCAVAHIRQRGAAEDASAHLRREFQTPDARDTLSGGEATRRRIAAGLSSSAPLLLADEPTSDLDAGGIALLTDRLRQRPGALLLVSHDRALLNALCSRVWLLEDGRIADFPGSYADFTVEMERRRAFAQFEYEQYRAEQQRLKASAQRMAERAASVKKAPARMGNSEARLHRREASDAILRLSHAKRTIQNRIERLPEKERPRDLPQIKMALGAAHPIEARTALEARFRQLRAGGRTLLGAGQFTLPTGSRTALLGDNGCGKSSLIRAILAAARDEPQDEGLRFSGTARLNPAARVALFDQNHERGLRQDLSALENAIGSRPQSDARTVLARLNLRGDDVFKPVSVLSGGERAKVALARALLSEANLLILDEPGNALDVFALEALEALLTEYRGTLLLVSHDREMVESVCTRLLLIENRSLRTFEGTLREKEEKDRPSTAPSPELSLLQMRMAELASRIAAPRRGDDAQALNEEYDRVAARVRELLGQGRQQHVENPTAGVVE